MQLDNGKPQIVVNGEGYDVSSVTHVEPTPISTSTK
jgi:hypothetical protein